MNILVSFLYIITFISIVHGEKVSISSSCNTKETDGLYYIKPTVDGEVIPVICSNGYTMLDASLNFDQVSTYFTSVYRHGDDALAMYGTDCSELSGWRDWFIPANDMTKFRVATGCQECIAGEQWGDNTAYYMTNMYFCPVNMDNDGCQAKPDASMFELREDIMCNICDDTNALCGGHGHEGSQLTGAWCDCKSLQLSADHESDVTHDEYCKVGVAYRPNFLLDRSQCTCYQPDESENTEYTVDVDHLPLVSSEYKDVLESDLFYVDDLIQWEDENTHNAAACRHRHIHLTQKDFLYGTYRITECGTYILDEDIVINFNAPSDVFSYENGDSPNAYDHDDFPWFPTTEQQNSGEYFGFNAFWGPFTLGFFAGISIETSKVTLDLNGHSIAMHEVYYLQQRFFALIELGNKQFEAKQGPVDFGRDDIQLKKIYIHNGILGLSSHHGIHGMNAHEVTIKDIQIQHFDVGGIQCNGCYLMNIEHCNIGPQNTNIPVLGRYVHGRSVLGRLRYMVDEYGDEEIRFANREESTTVKAVADKLVEQMDMIFYHITQGIEFPEDDPTWQLARHTFLNPTGWLDGGSSYGILLNGQGTAVVNIGRRLQNTYEVTIRDVEIHDLAAMPRENFWGATPDDGSVAIVHGFFFETIDWNYGGVYDEETGYYVGDAYTDILFAANTFLTEDFCPLGPLFYLDGLMDWAFVDGTDVFNQPELHDEPSLQFKCGSDIQSHSAKGPIGIRMDGTKNFKLIDVHIHDLSNWGEIGSDACGEYEEITFVEGFGVDKDIQYGYSGDNTHGILANYATGTMKNIKVENLQSWYGNAMGIFIAKGSTVKFDGFAQINNIVAGQKLEKKRAEALTLPNAVPFVCSIFIGPNSDADVSPELTPSATTTTIFSVDTASTMYGYDSCGQQHQTVGDVIEPITPELYMADIDEKIALTLNLDAYREQIRSYAMKDSEEYVQEKEMLDPNENVIIYGKLSKLNMDGIENNSILSFSMIMIILSVLVTLSICVIYKIAFGDKKTYPDNKNYNNFNFDNNKLIRASLPRTGYGTM